MSQIYDLDNKIPAVVQSGALQTYSSGNTISVLYATSGTGLVPVACTAEGWLIAGSTGY